MIMAIEIERKFLVKGVQQTGFQIRTYRAGIYLLTTRTDGTDTHPGEEGFLTIKGASDENGLSRYEFEQKIPPADAEELLKLCEPGIIDKVRNLVPVGKHTWEVDVFHGDNEGLILAEIELASEDEPFERPDWVGHEVSGDRRYYNSMLTKYPYKQW